MCGEQDGTLECDAKVLTLFKHRGIVKLFLSVRLCVYQYLHSGKHTTMWFTASCAQPV